DNPAALISNLSSVALAPAGTPLYETTYDNFAPRVGVTYQLLQRRGREMVLRGGFGTFYDLTSGFLVSPFFPYARSKSSSNVPYPVTPELAAPPPFSTSLSSASGNIFVSDPHLKLPRTYQWNVTLEQSIGPNQTVSASYVGAAGRRLLRRETIVTPTSLFIITTRNTATSDYHALQLQFQRRLSRGLQALAAYTWSH